MSTNNILKLFPGLMMSCMVFTGCKKLTQVGEPVNTITTAEVFGNDATATSAVAGIYNNFLSTTYGNGNATINMGMSADELRSFGDPTRFETNTLSPDYDYYFWLDAYFDIYLANAIIEALPASTGVSSNVKTQLSAEAKFFRAYFYFALVNLFGDVPLPTSTAYKVNDTLHRSSSDLVFQLIVADLKAAQSALPGDYSSSGGERTGINKWAATAMLARTYLYQGKWDSAEAQATSIIENTSLYDLTDLNGVFSPNNPEAILQLQTPNTFPYSTKEALQILPYNNQSNPNFYLTDQLLGAFEENDLRRPAWVDSTNYDGIYYYYPFKYKVRIGESGNIAEYYTILRLAEQFLIRSEARAHQNNLDGALQDLNKIRERAGLSLLSNSLAQEQVLAAVMQERRIELFAELGHRWMDLKRTGLVDQALSGIKPTYKPTAKLYPIPSSELVNDPNLTQNPGY